MTAFIFPGQGAQFVGMGADLYNQNEEAKRLFEQANDILGFRISDIMFNGTEEELRQTRVTQPAIFIHSVVSAMTDTEHAAPDAVAGHSLGEFSALVAAGVLRYEDGLRLVAMRAEAMQAACEEAEGTMAAVIRLDDRTIEKICAELSRPGHIVVPANYNCPGQVVISGHRAAVEEAGAELKAAGARRALMLPVGGAFHSPLMESAAQQLKEAIEATPFFAPKCPVYQNVDADAHTDTEEIRANLLAQLTSSVKWADEVRQMADDGIDHFVEHGPGQVLTGLVEKIVMDKG